jgi:membrane associated rhomboid family serine protease
MPVARRPFLPQFTSLAAKLAIALVAASIVGALLPSTLRPYIYLSPERVIHGLAIWQPFSYAFLATGALGVIFGALILWSIGGALEASWGSRRLLVFAISVTVLAGVLTVVISPLFPVLQAGEFAGGGVMSTSLWVAYGLSVGPRQSNFWGLPVTGNVLALIGAGFVFLNAIFGAWYVVVPDAFGILLSFVYVRGQTPRMWLLRLQSWWFSRQMKSRSKHLRVISKERNMPPDSDRYLH